MTVAELVSQNNSTSEAFNRTWWLSEKYLSVCAVGCVGVVRSPAQMV